MIEDIVITTWTRDFLMVFINDELTEMTRALSKDNPWKDCYKIQVDADAVVNKMRRDKMFEKLVERHPEVTDDYTAQLVAQLALAKGLAVTIKGVQVFATKKT